MATEKIIDKKLRWKEITATPNQYGSIAFPSDLESLWNEGRVAGILNASNSVVLVNVFYSGGKHYFSCWNVQTNTAFTQQITIVATYL